MSAGTCAGGCTFWECGRVFGHTGPCLPATAPAPFEIVDVLGNRALITHRYPDGSFDCPHCSYPVVAPALECAHPWCPAYPGMPVEAAEEIVRKREAERVERESRAQNMRRALARVEAERAERAAAWEAALVEVERRGACRRCAAKTFGRGGLGTKIVKHRGPCPLESR